ncbi:hypothetical protein SBA3_1820035 [Candidatus Sulfopaludibacter sp. SbA3]|nr:hypothetical protein SBA3_1820035 [Candidatus Sulfopaludibacter sp. SbA3]
MGFSVLLSMGPLTNIQAFTSKYRL